VPLADQSSSSEVPFTVCSPRCRHRRVPHGLMILLFLGIATTLTSDFSIPLIRPDSVISLGFLGNAQHMTLGRLAFSRAESCGDATVTIENIEAVIPKKGMPSAMPAGRALRKSLSQPGVNALLAIVFLPMCSA